MESKGGRNDGFLQRRPAAWAQAGGQQLRAPTRALTAIGGQAAPVLQASVFQRLPLWLWRGVHPGLESVRLGVRDEVGDVEGLVDVGDAVRLEHCGGLVPGGSVLACC